MVHLSWKFVSKTQLRGRTDMSKLINDKFPNIFVNIVGNCMGYTVPTLNRIWRVVKTKSKVRDVWGFKKHKWHSFVFYETWVKVTKILYLVWVFSPKEPMRSPHPLLPELPFHDKNAIAAMQRMTSTHTAIYTVASDDPSQRTHASPLRT